MHLTKDPFLPDKGETTVLDRQDAKQVNHLLCKLASLSSIPRLQEGKNEIPKLSSGSHTHAVACTAPVTPQP